MNNKRGFTLVELLAVITLLGILLMIAVPSVTRLQQQVNKNQVSKDAEMFILLAKQKIKSDLSLGGTSITVNLNDIDKTKLSGEYKTTCNVVASGCSFSSNKFDCTTYKITNCKTNDGKYTVNCTNSNCTVS